MIQVKNLPRTSTGQLLDNLVKDDESGAPGSTKIITVQDFITTYFLSTISTQSSITATAGGQIGATQLIKIYNRVDTVAANGRGVKLLPATKNLIQEVANNSANDLNIYPAAGDNFLEMAADTPMLISGGQKLSVLCYDDGEWTIN